MSDQIILETITLLRKKVSEKLCYHSVSHTEDVLAEAVRYATHDQKDPKFIELLKLAAVFHDSGFIEKAEENESLGAKFAAEAMHKAGYDSKSIEKVSVAIKETALENNRQNPTSELGKYLCDADLSNLGREDFFEKSELIFKETKQTDQKKFYQELLQFLEAHRWHTPAAKLLREKKKQENLAVLKVK